MHYSFFYRTSNFNFLLFVSESKKKLDILRNKLKSSKVVLNHKETEFQAKKSPTLRLSSDNNKNEVIPVLTSTPNEPRLLQKLDIRLSEVHSTEQINKNLFDQHPNKRSSNSSMIVDNDNSYSTISQLESSAPSGASSVARRVIKVIGDSWLKDSDELFDLEALKTHSINLNSGEIYNSSHYNECHDLPCINNLISDSKIENNFTKEVDTGSEYIENINNENQQSPEASYERSDSKDDGSFKDQADNRSQADEITETTVEIDNSQKDPNYSQCTNLSDNNNNNTIATPIEGSQATMSQSDSKNENKSTSFDVAPTVDIRNLKILCSKKKNNERQTTKKYFCPYCKTIQTKFARHLEFKHRDHEDVQKMMSFEKNTKQRRDIIAKIRKEGIFIHNMDHDSNTGHLMVARRRQRGKRFKNKTVDDYVCCAHCKGFYSKSTIRLHYVHCDKNHEKGAREILKKGRRKTGYMHPRANEVLRRDVFPVLRDGELKRTIAFDELLVIFGNRLCDKYTELRYHDMIRADLRYLGKHLIAARTIDPKITDYASLLRPKHLQTVVEAVKIVAKWNNKTKRFDVPANATRLTNLIKKCAKKYRSECIQQENRKEKERVDNFIELWTDEIPTLINKKAVKDQKTLHRSINLELPTKEDIALLYKYLKDNCLKNLNILEGSFNLLAWQSLRNYTAVFIQIFNRRRPGDVETITLEDFNNPVKVNKKVNPDVYDQLSQSAQKIAGRFTRITTRGKLDRIVPVLLHRFIVKCISLIIKYRKHVGVKNDNPFIFCRYTTNSSQKPYIRICPLLRKYAVECGAKFPERLRATKLRKHVATSTAMIGLEDAKVDRLANFMGHHKEIHKNIYRVDVPVAEMTLIAQLLKTAMSHDEDDNSSGSSSSDENEGEDDNNDEEIHDVIKTIQTSEKVVSVHKISRTRRNRCDDSDYESKNNVTMNKSG